MSPALCDNGSPVTHALTDLETCGERGVKPGSSPERTRNRGSPDMQVPPWPKTQRTAFQNALAELLPGAVADEDSAIGDPLARVLGPVVALKEPAAVRAS